MTFQYLNKGPKECDQNENGEIWSNVLFARQRRCRRHAENSKEQEEHVSLESLVTSGRSNDDATRHGVALRYYVSFVFAPCNFTIELIASGGDRL